MRRVPLSLLAIGLLLFGGIGYYAGAHHALSPSSLAAADDCQTFPETGWQVCGAFLNYWKTHGGLAQQGYPVSGTFQEKSETDGKTYTVQYFERAVFEAHPENQPPNDVLLSLLGSQKYKTKYGTGAPATSSPPSASSVAGSTSGGLSVTKSGFGQDGKEVGVGFIVENGGPTLETSQYRVSAYAADGTVIGTTTGYLALILAGQRIGVGDDLYLNDTSKVVRIDVQVQAGKQGTRAYPPAFTTDKAAFKPDKYGSVVSGVVKSTAPSDQKELRVSGILYDGAGNIVGGGYTYLNFIPANGQTAVEVSVHYAGAPARTELYVILSGLSSL